MQIPVDITFKDFAPSEALRARIQEHVAKLEQHFLRITRCEVAVELPHRHHHNGRRFRVRIRLTVPGAELVAHSDEVDGAHEDAYVALRDAFLAIRRQLDDHRDEIAG
jgi:ribosomal subunit interface protein